MTLNPAIFRELQDLQRGMTDRLPRYLVKALAAGLYAEGKDFLAAFRQQIRGRFKTGGSKFANTFKTFTAGDRLDNLKLEAFTRLEWAPIYERGGTITPRGSWLIVPVSPRLLTPTGRVKRRYRDPKTGRWADELFKDLFWIKVRGGLLGVRHVQASAAGRVRPATFGARRSRSRSAAASEPVVLLIRSTRRHAVLGFEQLARQRFGITPRLTSQTEKALNAAVKQKSG